MMKNTPATTGGSRHHASRPSRSKAVASKGKPKAVPEEEEEYSDDADTQDVHPSLMLGHDSDAAGSEEEEEEEGPSTQDTTAISKHGRDQAKGHKRSFASMLASSLDVEALKKAFEKYERTKNFNRKQELQRRLAQQADTWHMELREGFSLLFYGYGSKRELLEQFARQQLTDGAVMVFNGYNPRLSAHQVVAGTAMTLTHKRFRCSSAEHLRHIREEPSDRHIYVLLHNIDGPGLRGREDQELLAELASCPGVHLLASVDHANAGLLWSTQLAARFRWMWKEACTFAAYTTETVDMPPVLCGRFQQAGRLQGAGTVLRSMVANAREVFKVLAEFLLDDPEAEGASFPLLYRMCRERLLVSSEQALKVHLTEFRDHELIKLRTTSDGIEVMYVPLEADALRKVLDEMDTYA